jgi:hypothetical protein
VELLRAGRGGDAVIVACMHHGIRTACRNAAGGAESPW